jgi:hypothetical protein
MNIIFQPARPWVSRTGQTAVQQTGDDGTFQAGRPGTVRFVDNGNGTVFDRHTGLTWVKQPELIIPGAVGVHATNQVQAARGDWANATAYAAADLAKDTSDSTYWACAVGHTSAAGPTTFAEDRAAHATYWRQTIWTANAANLTTIAPMTWANCIDNALGTRWGGLFAYAGFVDWRVPNVHELLTLLNFSRTTTLDPVLFPNNPVGGSYWSATTVAQTVANAWRVTAGAGVSGIAKTTALNVRPVRGGRTILG